MKSGHLDTSGQPPKATAPLTRAGRHLGHPWILLGDGVSDVSLWSHLVLASLPQFISKRDPEDVKEVRLLGGRGPFPSSRCRSSKGTTGNSSALGGAAAVPQATHARTRARTHARMHACAGPGWGGGSLFPPSPLPAGVKACVPGRWWSGSGTATSASCMGTWPTPTATSSAAWRSSRPFPAPRCLVSADLGIQARDGGDPCWWGLDGGPTPPALRDSLISHVGEMRLRAA